MKYLFILIAAPLLSFTSISTDFDAPIKGSVEVLFDGGSVCCTRSASMGEPGEEGYTSISITKCATGTGLQAESTACYQAGMAAASAMQRMQTFFAE
jgi:hypothetical protein